MREPLDSRADNLRGKPLLGLLLSVVLHTSFIVPLCIFAFILGRAAETERLAEKALDDDAVDMDWETVTQDELPTDLPPIEDKPPPRIAKAKPTLEEKPLAAPEAEVAEEKPPEEKPPEEKPPAPPPPPEQQRLHEKLVDLDQNEKVEPSPDAKYLAQANNRTDKETRATDTNLEKELKGTEPSSQPSDNQDDRPGDADDKIARIADVASRLGREAPNTTPVAKPSTAPSASPADRKRAILSMRQVESRPHTVTPETANPSLARDPDGLRTLPDEPEPTNHATDNASHPDDQGAKTRLRLTGQEMQYLFGKEMEADVRLAQTERSRRRGKFSRHLENARSALENFIPEVQPGNQTRLNTRAAPFAAYLANMHRNIHELWGFGFLPDLDGRTPSHPMNNRDLWTRLEIVLGGDGTVDNIKVIRSSGLVTFDVAAVDVIYSAGPYPEPPSVIRSKNGKIYLHWSFHRDERQCATFGADYFILDNPASDGDTHDATSVPRLRPEKSTPSRKLSRLSNASGGEQAQHEHRVAEPDMDAQRLAELHRPRDNDPVARRTAEGFFAGYVTGDAQKMMQFVGFPFSGPGGVAASGPRQLESQLKGLFAESSARRGIQSLQIHSAAGLRSALHWVPEPFGDDHRLLFGVAIAGGDTFAVVLSPYLGGWKITALFRH